MIFLLLWLAFGLGGYFIGKDKGRAGEGLAWGLLLGIIGIIVIACRKPVDRGSLSAASGPFSPGGSGWTPDEAR